MTHILQLALTSNDPDRALAMARATGGSYYADPREPYDHLPFRALVTATTDDADRFATAADVGLYVVCRRTIKAGDAAAIGIFPLVHHPERTHTESDAHWRDKHAPLALVHHPHMTHYTQLSVVARLAGPDIDGFAFCGFASVADLRDRFYTEPASIKVIANDVASFADTKRSPRRLIATDIHL